MLNLLNLWYRLCGIWWVLLVEDHSELNLVHFSLSLVSSNIDESSNCNQFPLFPRSKPIYSPHASMTWVFIYSNNNNKICFLFILFAGGGAKYSKPSIHHNFIHWNFADTSPPIACIRSETRNDKSIYKDWSFSCKPIHFVFITHITKFLSCFVFDPGVHINFFVSTQKKRHIIIRTNESKSASQPCLK